MEEGSGSSTSLPEARLVRSQAEKLEELTERLKKAIDSSEYTLRAVKNEMVDWII